MGRGRQKAKHTKVARELKYFSPDTNYNELERELTSREPGSSYTEATQEDDVDKWSEFTSDADAETRTA